MANTNHICSVCQTEYLYCDDCGEFGSYKTICCSEEHYKIFLIVKKYYVDKDKSNALKSLNAIGFDKTEISTLTPSIKNALHEIYADSAKEDKNTKETTTINPKQVYKSNFKGNK